MTPDPRDGSMAGWQPVDTAPRDWTPLLIAAKHARAAVPDLVVAEAYYDAAWRGGSWYFANTVHPCGDRAMSLSESGWVVTHWQSLPSPPKVE